MKAEHEDLSTDDVITMGLDVRDNGPLLGFCNWLMDHELLPCSRLPGPVEGAPVAG
jgi:hypothetical protein